MVTGKDWVSNERGLGRFGRLHFSSIPLKTSFHMQTQGDVSEPLDVRKDPGEHGCWADDPSTQ